MPACCSVELRLGLQQRVLPAYRAPFIETLSALCPQGLGVFAGLPQPGEAIATANQFTRASYVQAANRHLFDPSSPLYFCWQGRLRGWLEDFQPQALIVEANPRYLSTPAAVSWMHRRGRPVLGWGLGAPALGGGWLDRLRKSERANFLRRLDGVIAYSRRGADEYMTAGFPAQRVFVAANAASPRPPAPPQRKPQPGAPLRILFVGRLQARKRLDLLLQACARLPVERQPELVIVGDGPARPEFEAQARQLYPRAQFAGARHGEELAAYFAAADLFVLPGTGGLAVQQAMAAGLPVIVAQGDGTQDDLVRPESGWQVTPGDLEALAQTLAAALADRPRLEAMGKAAYRIVAEEINLESMAESFARAVNQVAELGLRQGSS